jgi:hypothetical protein
VSEEIPGSAAGETPAFERGFRLLDEARAAPCLTVRDDQQAFAWLLDAACTARRHGRRFRLVDSGRLDVFSLEWLAKAGADLYTADDIRPEVEALARIRKAGRVSGGRTVFFLYGPIEAAPAAGALSLEMVIELVRSGVDLHVSNRKIPRDPAALIDLAVSRRAGGAEVVYYHHGPLMKELVELTGAGTWVHVSNSSLDFKAAELGFLRDIGRAGGRGAGGGLVVHVDTGIERALLDEIRKSGAHFIFNVPFEKKFLRAPLLWRAYYLDTTFLP